MATKKLIEVALPLEAINRQSSKEKSIRQGHPNTLHLWWARRPLSTARAIIWASLVDDPSCHPEVFKTEEEQNYERDRLFRILEELVRWDNINNEQILSAARNEIYKSIGKDKLPRFYDPFAGGGSIPLEAQRLGLDTYTADLNPVSVIINKAMLEIPPLFYDYEPVHPTEQSRLAASWKGLEGLAEDIEYYGAWVEKEAYKRIGHLFPKVDLPKERGGGKGTVITWMQTRTVKCPNPACQCNMPLIKSFTVVKDKKKPYYIEPIIEGRRIRYDVRSGTTKRKATVNRKGATCLFCNSPVDFEYIREEGQKGRLGTELITIVVEGDKERLFLPAEYDRTPANIERPNDYPDSEIAYYPGCTNCRNYGMKYFGDLYTNRQLVSLVTFSDLVLELREKIFEDANKQNKKVDSKYIDAIQLFLALGVDRLASRSTMVCVWDAGRKTVVHPFGRQAIPMVWTFPENNPFCKSTGGWKSALSWIPKVVLNLSTQVQSGHVMQNDATSTILPDKYMISMDPPYYSNVPYADLADFFYLWLKKMLRHQYPELFSTIETPKNNELVAEKYRFDGDESAAKEFFEEGMLKTFMNVREYLDDEYPLSIYYAFKQTDDDGDGKASSGWETMLNALIKAGFSIVGTWPVQTEQTTGLKTNLNSLGSSIVLVCRKRDEKAQEITRRNLVMALRRELKSALKKLQASNIAPVDLAQSAIGPGMGVFSRYNRVLEADGRPMSVRSALHVINEEIDLYFNEQVGDLDAMSRFCVDLYTQNAFNDIKFGEADVLARAKGTSVAALASHDVVYAKAGTVHLIERTELPDKIDNAESCIWMLTQQLTQAMATGGVEECAKTVFMMLGSNAERAKDLAYRLYTIAEQKKWASEAFAYNALVVAWPDIQSRAAMLQRETPEQLDMFNMGLLDN